MWASKDDVYFHTKITSSCDLKGCSIRSLGLEWPVVLTIFFPLNFRHLIKQRIRLNFLICDSEDGNLWPSSALPKLKCPSARLHDNDALGGSSSEARIHEMRNLMETSSLPASDNSLTLHIDTTSSFFSPRFISHSGDKAFQGTRKAQKNADRRNETKATTQWIQ